MSGDRRYTLDEARQLGMAVDYPVNPSGEGQPTADIMGRVNGARRFGYVTLDEGGRGGWLHMVPGYHVVPAPWIMGGPS